MSNRLEDFVRNNREDFDRFDPGPVVWNNIQQQLKKPAEKKGILISITTLRWSAAAAIIIFLGAGAWYFIVHNKTTQKQEFVKKDPTPATSNNLPETPAPVIAKTAPVAEDTATGNKTTDKNTSIASRPAEENDANEELVHYTRLVEIKQRQIRRIEKDEPLLYSKFAGDFSKLDSTFHILKKQLPVNPNREQILEAMIQNLQYQEALLSQQLNIIKKINNTKKQAYEKAYRSA